MLHFMRELLGVAPHRVKALLIHGCPVKSMSSQIHEHYDMAITVRFFASLRERIGQAHIQVSLPAQASVAEVWAKATGETRPSDILAAVNMSYADFEQIVADGDEVAFFPQVTGG